MPHAWRGRTQRTGGALLETERAQRARPPVGCTALPCCLFSVFDESSRLSSPSPLFVVCIAVTQILTQVVLGDM